MYRVELKVCPGVSFPTKGKRKVPNVPCGVERSFIPRIVSNKESVPNVPCGVESVVWDAVASWLFLLPALFLMYRVELKAILSLASSSAKAFASS